MEARLQACGWKPRTSLGPRIPGPQSYLHPEGTSQASSGPQKFCFGSHHHPPGLPRRPAQLHLTCPSNRPRDCTRKVAQPTCSTGVGLPSSHLQMPS